MTTKEFVFIFELCLQLMFISLSHGAPQTPTLIGTKNCSHYDNKCSGENCINFEECKKGEGGNITPCFTLWQADNTTGLTSVLLKGCFIDTVPCVDKPPCKMHNAKKDLLFCCCEGDFCNDNDTFPGFPPATEPPPLTVVEEIKSHEEDFTMLLVYTLTPLIILLFILIAFYVLYRQRKMNLFNELPTTEPSSTCPPSPAGLDELGTLPVVLREIRARGRFGAVWRANLNQQEVAVKVFPIQDKQSWMTEYEIFKLPKMTHPNILQFMGVDKKGDNLQAEYWLITAYHDKGSLCDYLKSHILTWPEAYNIAVTMARGLTHLHEENVSSIDGGYKPSIAHRDFKSKNVLLKNDMSACIADFGLALVFQPGKPCGDTHGQVGTRRYMAPEVLEGAINFTKDAFLRIDMYACGLVIWEIASRCIEVCNADEMYRLPLEEEVGSHPTLEEMQDAVVMRKLRPNIKPIWRAHQGLNVLCDTMEECWDHDAEARLSASCVLERVESQGRINNNNATSPTFTDNTQPLLVKDFPN